MDLFTLLVITAFVLLGLLVILVVIWVSRGPAEPFIESPREARELRKIKHEIEHEAELESEEELAPYKPPRLSRPTKKRL